MGEFRPAYRNIVVKIASSNRGAAIIQTYANKKFTIAKQDFLNNFDSHPATQSIEAGARNPAANYPVAGLSDGNLYSFLGIPVEEGNPIPDIRNILQNETVLTKSKTEVVGNGAKTVIRINYSLRTPRQKLFDKTKLYWDSGLSFLYDLERGISGLSHYLSRKLRNPPSRSTGGIQTEKQIRGGNDTAKIPYLNSLLRGLVTKFRSL